MKLVDIYSVVNKELTLVDAKIKEAIPRKDDAFREACVQILNANSKRIRAALVLLCSKMLKYKRKASLKLATAIELFHTATLVHDDIIDSSAMRRGNETINRKYGLNSAILVADYLYLNGALLLNGVFDGNLHLNDQLTKIMISTAQKMFSGELDQLMNNSVYISRKEYFKIISQKTASFFSACCAMPALLSNAGSLQGSALFMYGRNLGIAFQITDDVLDIIGDEEKFGKKKGSDIKEGFFTLPLVHFYEKASYAEKKTLLDVLARKKLNLKEIVKLLARYRSVEYAQDRAKSYSKKAKKSIGIFPDSAAKDSLIQLCDFVVARDH